MWGLQQRAVCGGQHEDGLARQQKAVRHALRLGELRIDAPAVLAVERVDDAPPAEFYPRSRPDALPVWRSPGAGQGTVEV